MFGRKDRAKSRRWAAEMERQAEDQRLVRSKPAAIVLRIVDNGPKHGWKWLCFDYDPDGARVMAGAVEGVLVPHGMQSGYENLAQARAAGIAAIRRADWDGPIVLDEPCGQPEPEASVTARSKSDGSGVGE